MLAPILLYDPALDLVSVFSVFMFFLIQIDPHFLLRNPFSLLNQICDHDLLFFRVMPLADLHSYAASAHLDHCFSYSSDSIVLRSHKGFIIHHKEPKYKQGQEIVLFYTQLLDQPYHMDLL